LRYDGIQKAHLSELVWIDPDRMSDTTCFAGTRVPLQQLIWLPGGWWNPCLLR
jgi:uncharacterized protein (DUF433 family)